MVRASSTATGLADRVDNGTALVPTSAPTNIQLLDKQKDAIAKALPSMLTVERYIRSVQTLVRRPETHLAECTPTSFLGAVVTLAQLGLEPGPLGLSYIEARKNGRTGNYEARPGIQYRGFVELAGRSGRLLSIGAHDIRDGDDFTFDQAAGDISHKWDLKVPRGAVYGHYGVANLRGGGRVSLVMSCGDCEEYRKFSAAGSRNKGPWVTNKEAMHRKTLILRMEPWLPKSTELTTAFAVDGRTVEADPFTADVDVPSFDYDADPLDDDQAAEAELVEDDALFTPDPAEHADGGSDS
jgi:recombination protein RecT